MIEKLIEQYVNRINCDDIINFSNKYGITLKDFEVKIIYKHIKNNWHTIVYGNPRKILDDIKLNCEPITYNKIIELYQEFKNKYSSYL